MSEQSLDENPALVALWGKVLDSWEERSRHDALLTVATAPRDLRWLAERYGEELVHPERTAIARKRLEALAIVAMARLERPARPAARQTFQRWAIALSLLLMTLALLWMAR